MQVKLYGPHMRDAKKNAGEDGARSVTAYIRHLIEIDTAKRQGRFSCHVDALQIDEFLNLACCWEEGGAVAITAKSGSLGIWPYIGPELIVSEGEGGALALENAIQKAREMLHEDVEGER